MKNKPIEKFTLEYWARCTKCGEYDFKPTHFNIFKTKVRIFYECEYCGNQLEHTIGRGMIPDDYFGPGD